MKAGLSHLNQFGFAKIGCYFKSALSAKSAAGLVFQFKIKHSSLNISFGLVRERDFGFFKINNICSSIRQLPDRSVALLGSWRLVLLKFSCNQELFMQQITIT